ncbi:SMC family ATPase [Candidatus Woesearchaeota archaeon]|jgi:DNA repair protein SbcC/Rad50|nr:SMC family ATPase [Candidatus Woesearchaeota archaeon]MBT3537939.1 SMC family ATPase [Candidatus Woesearchaeota archaeon]MBT4698077.1 SMC family ATPase [Candidatus Woesearchaeota archaeon]MBT4717184.1 SMC family ATPase [Candidatus Woesearchaeota archaeon]MBT7105608.1 SMC family ATPase [Candidatus Woesearchaeota archaeon]
MILKSLKLENIRSYLCEKIDFPEGSLLLSGDIGSGKSTVLQAIEFALFGTRRDQLSAESLLRHGEIQGSVELAFNIKGEDISIRRNLRKTKDSIKQEAGFIIRDNVKKEATAIELKTIIIEMLGYPQDLVSKSKSMVYRYTVYTPQEDMKSIIYDDKETRLNTLRKVFGIDKYKLIKENAVTYVRTLKEKRKELEGRFADLAGKLKQKELYEEESKRITKDVEIITPTIRTLKEQITQKKELIQQGEDNVKRFLDTKKKILVAEEKVLAHTQQIKKQQEWIERLDVEILSINNKLSTMKIDENPINSDQIDAEIEELQTKIQSKEKKESELNAILNSTKESVKIIQEEITIKESKLKLLNKKKDDLDIIKLEVESKKIVEEELNIINKELDELKAKINECTININLSTKTKEDISSLDTCPTCIQPVTTEHKTKITETEDGKIATHSKEKDTLTSELTEKENKIKSLKEQLITLQEKEKNFLILKSELENLKEIQNEITQKETQRQDTNKKAEELERQINSLKMLNTEALLAQINKKKELLKTHQDTILKIKEKSHLEQSLKSKNNDKTRLRSQRDNLQEETNALLNLKITLEKRVSELKECEVTYENLRHDLEQISKQEKEVEIKHAQLTQNLSNINKVLEDINDEVKLKVCFKEKAQKVAQIQNWLEEYFVNLVTLMEKQIMSKVYHQFNNLFSEWFNLIIEDEMLSAKLDEEFTPVVMQNGYETNVRSLSGGEKTALALSYRLALNKVINDVISEINTKDLIILDEPTDGFSAEQLDRVRDVIQQLKMRQIIVVSHESKVESFVESVLKITKDNHVSTIS